MTLSILSIVGARPQFVKAAAVSRAIGGVSGLTETLVHTGQHYDENMSDVFFEELEISRPHYNLAIGSGTHGAQTGRMLAAIEEILMKTSPDWVLVYGDTNSTLAGALASTKLHIPIAHIEAGLRSYNRQMPEEINRILTDHAADLLFAPTETAVKNLLREGMAATKIQLVGDVMYDTALFYGSKAEQNSSILEKLHVSPGGYVLATIHRAENSDDPARLKTILEGLGLVAREMPVIFPVHPRTRSNLEKSGLLDSVARQLQVTQPLGYLDMIMLEKHAALVATDSGGVQKEAYFYEVPCMTLRYETEWVELVESGWNRLVPPDDAAAILSTARESLGCKGMRTGLYGDGNAARKIVSVLQEHSPVAATAAS